MRRNARQTVVRHTRSENDGDSLSGDSWEDQMKSDEKQLTGVLEHEDIVLQRLIDVILPAVKITWEEAVESTTLE